MTITSVDNLADAIPDPGENFLRYLGDPMNENFIFAKVTSQMVLEIVSLLKSKNYRVHVALHSVSMQLIQIQLLAI